MSLRYKGAVISATPPTTTGGNSGTAPGAWTLQQQLQAQGAGNWPNQPIWYVEDVFSTWLYTGTGSDQTLTTGVDLSTYGGMIWSKRRSAVENHFLQDTNRGLASRISSNTTGAAATTGAWPMNAISTTGMTVSGVNYAAGGETYVSWTFRKQPKFFDVVTYTGNGVAGRTVAHNLGSTPGCIIVKATSAANDWLVYHTSLGNTQGMSISSTSAAATSTTYWNNTSPTSTQFTVGTSPRSNENGTTFVAYLFAHNAGGFGLTGTDNVISCGSYSGNGSASGPTVTLGYEPQWVMIKRASGGAADWVVFDNMRGMPVGSADATLRPNTADAETAATDSINPTATGFYLSDSNSNVNAASSTYIYIAIRRGPMKTPTSGTSVFNRVARAGTSADATVNAGFPPDSLLVKNRGGSANTVDWSFNFFDKLRSPGYRLSTAFTDAEDTSINFITSFDQNGVTLPATGYTATNGSGYNYINYFFRRAPGFFDEVCYTGTGSALTVNHNLGAVPELMIVKRRDSTGFWAVYSAATGAANVLELQSSAASTSGTAWNSTAPTASVFTVGNTIATGVSGGTYVAYLFASCPGVSKVGSYTGTGTTKQIDCGFTGGARFVLIKRTDSTGDWYVWDSARGIVAGNDPYLLLNSTAAEVTNTDYVDTYAAGFEISSTAPAAINANGGTFIFLAVS